MRHCLKENHYRHSLLLLSRKLMFIVRLNDFRRLQRPPKQCCIEGVDRNERFRPMWHPSVSCDKRTAAYDWILSRHLILRICASCCLSSMRISSCVPFPIRLSESAEVESVILIVSVIWRKPVLTYAVTVSIDGLGEFGEFGEVSRYFRLLPATVLALSIRIPRALLQVSVKRRWPRLTNYLLTVSPEVCLYCNLSHMFFLVQVSRAS